ncbi:glycosyltransferase family 39 protein [Candidatus Saccharibacteria bacterium]|nr:glycosyltransferase family 39 protein [Candidatus Saccharibacteria bacterium]
MIAFFGLLSFLPSIAPNGLSDAEMQSAIDSDAISANFIQEGRVIDLPYHVLQKISISIFGLSLYAIKLPSIIIAVLAGFFIVLLLNRWFKSDVAIVGSILVLLSTAFLFLAGSGTATIMLVFWLALLLWLGSKIVGNDHTPPILTISFVISVALSLYTPHLFYVAAGIAIAGLLHPHLRFSLKQLKFYQLIICIGAFVITIAPLVLGCIFNHDTFRDLIWMRDFSFDNIIHNISTAFAPFFSFSLAYDSVYLAPLFGLANIVLTIIGVLASIGKLFTSRNTVVSLLTIFAIFVSGLNQNIAITIIIPITVLSTAGLESIIEKWHSLFPENPYAHIIGTAPIVVVVLMIVFSGLSHFIFGYHYTPRVAKNFSDDINIIQDNLQGGAILIVDQNNKNLNFYRLLDQHNNFTVYTDIPEEVSDEKIAILNQTTDREDLALKQIITSSKTRNSDRLYIYEKVIPAEKTAEKGE